MFNKIILSLIFWLRIVCALIDVTVDQSLHNSGFHRLLTSNITLYANLTSCLFLAEEKFPQNFYIASDVIENFNKSNNALLKLSHRLNTEVFASSAIPFSAYIFLNNSQPLSTSTEFHTTYIYNIPLRIRYHDPQSGGGVKEFKKPPVLLYARCQEGLSIPKSSVIKLPCDPFSQKTCEWNLIPFTQKTAILPIIVPVGDTDHFFYVFISTHMIAYIGLFALLYNLTIIRIVS